MANLTVTEFSKKYQITEQTTYNYLKVYGLPHTRDSNNGKVAKYLIDEDEAEEWMTNFRGNTSNTPTVDTRLKEARAVVLETKAARENGELIPRDTAILKFATVLSTVSQRLDELPNLAAPELTGVDDIAGIIKVLNRQIQRVKAELRSIDLSEITDHQNNSLFNDDEDDETDHNEN